MNERVTKRVVMGVVIAGLLAFTVRAEEQDDGFKRLVVKWQTERAEIVREVVHGWLRGAPASSQKDRMVRLIQLDVRLAMEPGVQLYVSRFKDPSDTEQCVRDVVLNELRDRGVNQQASRFFEGKSFTIVKEEKVVVARNQVRQ